MASDGVNWGGERSMVAGQPSRFTSTRTITRAVLRLFQLETLREAREDKDQRLMISSDVIALPHFPRGHGG